MSTRLNPDIYATVEPEVRALPAEERRALLERDTTQAKEEIIFYRERAADLMASLKSMASKMVVDRDKYTKEMLDEHGRVDELRKEIKTVENAMKDVQTTFDENEMIIQEETDKRVQEMQTEHNQKKQKLKSEIEALEAKIADLVEFDQREMEYQTKLEDLSRERDYEMEKINRKQDLISQEEREYKEEKQTKETELNHVEIEKNECEQLIKVGSKELEKKKVDNQNRIDAERKVTQTLAEKNKGSNGLIRSSHGSPCIARLCSGVPKSECKAGKKDQGTESRASIHKVHSERRAVQDQCSGGRPQKTATRDRRRVRGQAGQ